MSGTVEVRDEPSSAGSVEHRFVERDVRAIFAYRQQELAARFEPGFAREG